MAAVTFLMLLNFVLILLNAVVLASYSSFQTGDEYNRRCLSGFNHQFCRFQDRFVACQANFFSSMAIQRSETSSSHRLQSFRPVCKWCKHGYICLSLPLHNSATDITICDDISLNPGSRGIHLNQNELRRHLDDQHCQQWSTTISYSRNELLKIRPLTRRLYQLSSDHCFHLKLAGLFIFRGSRNHGFSLNIPVNVLQGAGHRFAYHQYKYHHVHGANQRNLGIISIASRGKITRDAKLDVALLNARSICN